MGGQLPDCTIEDPGFRHFCGLHAWAGHPRLSGGGNALYRAISAFGGGCLRRNEQSYRSSIDQPVLYLCAPRGGVALFAIARQPDRADRGRSEEHTSELQYLMRISYAVFCLKK